MKLKNEALQELYDTLVNSTISMSPYADSPIDKAFRECDDELSESVTFTHIKNLQNRNDVLEANNKILLGDNLDLTNDRIRLRNRVEELKKRVMETTETLEKVNADRNELRRENADVHELIDIKNEELEATLKDLDDAKKQLKYFTESRDSCRARAKHAEKEVEDLKETLEKANADRTELQNDRDTYNSLYTELSKAYYDLHKKYSECQATVDQQAERIRYFKTRLNSVWGIDYGQGQTDLWDMLQNVNDSQPYDFDAECDGMEDVISMDLEDFLDTYKKWQEEKEKERTKLMRDYLERFCMGRLCYRCPLHTDGFNCSRGKWLAGIPDEDVRKYYEKARDYNKRPWHGDATAETPIKDLASWSCTMEATVEINKDLLEKVCGIKLDDK